MGSFGKTALSGQVSDFSPEGKWVRLVISAFWPFVAENLAFYLRFLHFFPFF
jgi:hypothetical protein